MVEHKPPTRILQPSLSWEILYSCHQVLPPNNGVMFSLVSLFSFYQVRTRLVMQFNDFQNMYCIHLQPLVIFSSAGIRLVLSHSRFFLMVFAQQICISLCRQMFINTYTFQMMVVVVLQVSRPSVNQSKATTQDQAHIHIGPSCHTTLAQQDEHRIHSSYCNGSNI